MIQWGAFRYDIEALFQMSFLKIGEEKAKFLKSIFFIFEKLDKSFVYSFEQRTY